jgi:PAS domain S-box-containing protein
MSSRRTLKTSDAHSFEGMRGPSDAEFVLAQLAEAFFKAEAVSPRAQKLDAARGIGRGEPSRETSAPFEFQEAGILYVNESGLVLDSGGRAAALFAASPGALTGKPASELFVEGLSRVPPFESGSMIARRLDGSTFRAAVTVSPMKLFGSSFWVLSLRDVNEEARAGAATRKVEARYRTLIEQIPAVTFMASLEEGDNEIYIGPQIEALLGYTQKEWLDDPVLWFRRMHPDDQERWNAEFARGCAVGGPFRADCRFFARDGRTVWVHGEARIVRDERGHAQFIQGVAFDITEIKEAEERMREAQETIVKSEKLAAIGRLAASVGHELRNPLAAIRNAWFYLENKLELEKLGATDARVAQFASVIQNEIERCAKIIGELLDFSRERPLYRVASPATELVRSALSVVVKPAETIRIVTEISEHLPVPNLDADQFRQVLVNLVQNAAEAVDPQRGLIEIRAIEQDGQLVFEVRDNGKGIPAEVQSKVFEPLFTTKLRGTGLGLAIVDGIVKRHGGEITVKSELGRGTSFRVRVPVSEPSVTVTPELGGASDWRSSSPGHQDA